MSDSIPSAVYGRRRSRPAGWRWTSRCCSLTSIPTLCPVVVPSWLLPPCDADSRPIRLSGVKHERAAGFQAGTASEATGGKADSRPPSDRPASQSIGHLSHTSGRRGWSPAAAGSEPASGRPPRCLHWAGHSRRRGWPRSPRRPSRSSRWPCRRRRARGLSVQPAASRGSTIAAVQSTPRGHRRKVMAGNPLDSMSMRSADRSGPPGLGDVLRLAHGRMVGRGRRAPGVVLAQVRARTGLSGASGGSSSRIGGSSGARESP